MMMHMKMQCLALVVLGTAHAAADHQRVRRRLGWFTRKAINLENDPLYQITATDKDNSIAQEMKKYNEMKSKNVEVTKCAPTRATAKSRPSSRRVSEHQKRHSIQRKRTSEPNIIFRTVNAEKATVENFQQRLSICPEIRFDNERTAEEYRELEAICTNFVTGQLKMNGYFEGIRENYVESGKVSEEYHNKNRSDADFLEAEQIYFAFVNTDIMADHIKHRYEKHGHDLDNRRKRSLTLMMKENERLKKENKTTDYFSAYNAELFLFWFDRYFWAKHLFCAVMREEALNSLTARDKIPSDPETSRDEQTEQNRSRTEITRGETVNEKSRYPKMNHSLPPSGKEVCNECIARSINSTRC